MEKLSPDKQDEIKQMSTKRLIASLIRIGSDEESVLSMNRPQLLDAWADAVAMGQDKPSDPKVAEATKQGITTAGTDLDLQRRMLEFEIRRYEEEKKAKEDEKEERRRREDEEKKARLRRERREAET